MLLCFTEAQITIRSGENHLDIFFCTCERMPSYFTKVTCSIFNKYPCHSAIFPWNLQCQLPLLVPVQNAELNKNPGGYSAFKESQLHTVGCWLYFSLSSISPLLIIRRSDFTWITNGKNMKRNSTQNMKRNSPERCSKVTTASFTHFGILHGLTLETPERSCTDLLGNCVR